MTSERGTRADERAVSDLVGIVLLIGMAIAGALLVVLAGGTAIESVEEQNQMKVAEQSMQKVSAQFQKISNNNQAGEFELPGEVNGDLTVKNQTKVEMVLNRQANCSTGEMHMGTIVYEDSSGEEVGYEGGGVYRKSTDNRSVMVSAPELEYRNGSLGFSMSNIDGHLSKSTSIKATLNRSASSQITENMTRSMFTDLTAYELQAGKIPTQTCSPQNADNITVKIKNSPYATAWHDYAKNTFDSDKVTVRPDTNTIGSGTTVEITFAVGDAALDPNYIVQRLDGPSPPSVKDTSDVTFDATIRNAGGLQGQQIASVTLLNDDTGSVVAGPLNSTVNSGDLIPPANNTSPPNRLVINGSETKPIEFTVPASKLSVPSGTNTQNYTVEIDTGDQVRESDFTVTDLTPADFSITSATAPSRAKLGENADMKVTVENTGGVKATEHIVFWFNGTGQSTKTFTLNGGQSKSKNFTIPTAREAADVPLNATVGNRPVSGPSKFDDSEKITIGDSSYYEITNRNAPGSVLTADSFEVNATINNTGDSSASKPVSITVQNTTTGTVKASNSTTLSLDGTLVTGGTSEKTVKLNVGSSAISQPGEYNYTIKTGDETKRGKIYVGSTPSGYIQIDSAPAPQVIKQNETLQIPVRSTNVGGTPKPPTIDFSFDSTNQDTENAGALLPGDSYYMNESASASGDPFKLDTTGYAPGTYDYEVASSDSSVTGQVKIVENITNPDYDVNGSKITNFTGTAELTVLGTALTGWKYTCVSVGWFGGCLDYDKTGIYRTPTEMSIMTENSSAGKVEHKVWGSKDLNRPTYRDDQINQDSWLSKNITVVDNDPNDNQSTSIWVRAESFNCGAGSWVDTNLNRFVNGNQLDSYRCDGYTDPGDSWLEINENTNPTNVDILSDGDQVPGFTAAQADQRSSADMLGSLIDPSGRLQLNGTQRVMLFELSKSNANPSNAFSSGDPDYNDAVVLFEVVNKSTKVGVKSAADFVINDTSGPYSISAGSQAQYDVEVWNRGGSKNTTTVRLQSGATLWDDTAVTLDPGESKTVTVQTPSLSPGDYSVTLDLKNEPLESVNRNLYVGTNPSAYFLPTVTTDNTVKLGNTVDLDTTVTNVGSARGKQTIDAKVTSQPGSSLSDKSWSGPALNLTAGNSASNTFSFTPSQTGSYTFTIASDNSTTSRTVRVEDSKFNITKTLVGPNQYDRGDKITVGTGLQTVSARVKNKFPVTGSHKLELELDDGTNTYSSTSPQVSLNSESKIVDITFPSSAGPGIYDYNISVVNPNNGGPHSYFTGQIEVVSTSGPSGPSGSSPPSSDVDYLNVDMNKIILG